MKPVLDFVESHSVLASILGAVVPFLFPKVRSISRFLIRKVTRAEIREAERKSAADAQAKLLELVQEIKVTLDANGGRLEVIEKEMKFNGGKTIKDMLVLLFNYRSHDYWRIGRPAMELDGNANVTIVTEAACRLFGVVNRDDLKRRSWLRFVDPDRVGDFLNAFADTVKYRSEFAWTFKVYWLDGTYRGEWEIRASPISAEGAQTSIYSAFLSPNPECQLAMEVAKLSHWTS